MGIFLFAVIAVVAASSLVLGWKKNSDGLILPNTATGTSTDLNSWKNLQELNTNACNELT